MSLLKAVLSFPALCQLLPAPSLFPEAERLYLARTYSNLKSVNVEVPQNNLDSAREFHESLSAPADVERMHAIFGYGQATYSGIREVDGIPGFHRLDHLEAYRATCRGDGVVAFETASLDGVTTYFVAEEQAGLTSNHEVVAAIDELLASGLTERLQKSPDLGDDEQAAQALAQSHDQDLRRSGELTRHLLLGGQDRLPEPVELRLEESLTRDLLSPRNVVARRSVPPSVLMKHPKVELSLVCAGIATLDYDQCRSQRSRYPVDAIAVGHYLGVKPAGSERQLDEAISRHVKDLAPEQEIKERDLILTQLSERGVLKGELGQPFFVPDPRDHKGNRIIAIAGMGVPGRFGCPELAVFARELIWSVGRLSKHHLAIAAVGKRCNVPLADAVRAWIGGLKHAITGAIESERRHIERLTIVINDPRIMEAAHEAILFEIQELGDRRRLELEFEPFTSEKLDMLLQQGFERDKQEMHEELARRRQRRKFQKEPELAPTRVTLALEGTSYCFAAMTSEASVPERAVPLDPLLVEHANARLASETDPDRQLDKGQFLGRLIVPEDLRRALATPAPLVMMLDKETAKVHWEMVAQGEPINSQASQAHDPSESEHPCECKFEYSDYFLGTSRGFTRQLHTMFAPPPEPPPPPRRVLRAADRG